MNVRTKHLAVVIGSGELASAIAHALHGCGRPTVMCDEVDPACMRRGMAYTDAWYVGDAVLEETTALFCSSARSVSTVLGMRDVIVATSWSWPGIIRLLGAALLVDARTTLRSPAPNLIDRASEHALTLGIAAYYVPGRNAHRAIPIPGCTASPPDAP